MLSLSSSASSVFLSAFLWDPRRALCISLILLRASAFCDAIEDAEDELGERDEVLAAADEVAFCCVWGIREGACGVVAPGIPRPDV